MDMEKVPQGMHRQQDGCCPCILSVGIEERRSIAMGPHIVLNSCYVLGMGWGL